MRVVDCEQKTTDWLNIRAGKVTASEIHRVMAMLKKGGESQARKDYKAKLLAETLTGMAILDRFVTPEMAWGDEQEQYARTAYEIALGVDAEQVGFVLHPTIDRSGCSPDGLIGDDGMVQIKCPNTATHLEYLISDDIPADYQLQMQWEMVCCDREWSDFVSYDPRLPNHLRMFVKRLVRDNSRIFELEQAVQQFLYEMDVIVSQLPKPEVMEHAEVN